MDALKTLLIKLICTVLLFSSVTFADESSDVINQEVKVIQKKWAEITYFQTGKEQFNNFDTLIDEIDKLNSLYPNSAELLTWSGIVRSTYAGAIGGLGALSLAKKSRKDLEKALEIDSTTLQGSAYTSLAALYAKVPGWPLGFGSEEKASELFTKALQLNPNGIDSNFFFANFLADHGRYKEANEYYKKAQAAPPRADRPVADLERQKEIKLAMAKIANKLN